MNLKTLDTVHNEIIQHVLNNRIHDAFARLDDLKLKIHDADIMDAYSTICDTYRNMLKFSFEYGPDPQRSSIYQKLQQSIIEITDRMVNEYASVQGLSILNKRMLENNHFLHLTYSELKPLLSNLAYESLVEIGSEPIIENNTALENQKKLANDLFHYLLITTVYKEKEKSILNFLLENVEVNWRLKCLLISSVTLSLLRHFDREKFIVLFNLLHHQQDEVRQRSIFGILINSLFYEKRLAVYPDITARLQAITDDKQLEERFLAQLLQYLRACDTESVTRKIQDEIVPEVLKIRNELEDKLNLKDLLNRENFEDKNPEWENFFKDAPDVYQKLEQFSQMQNEGSDVFMGAFAMLKHFTFFNEITNWFQPFYGNNLALNESMKYARDETDIKSLLNGLEQSSVLCNSDKYSFCLNIQYLPVQQRNMMLDLFNMEIKSMNESLADELTLNKESKNKIVNTQYIQDLYRFFKLHPQKEEFPDIFALSTKLTESTLIGLLFGRDELLRNLAEFYFSRDLYTEALPIYVALNQKTNAFELLEKIGYCYQKTNNYNAAIDAYHKAELFDRNKTWLIKKLSFCYRRIGQFEKAIKYYLEINRAEPDKTENQIYLGQLYIDIENYEEALKYYYKVEYEGMASSKIYRPIGWCNFVLGKTDMAIRYFEKIKIDSPLKSDVLNLGHCYWVKGNLTEALNNYREALKQSANDIIWFRKAFLSDAEYLNAQGIDGLDVSLMLDYILFT